MNIDGKEFNKFINELANALTRRGVSKDVVTTAIAEAIKNREDALKSIKSSREVRKEEEVVVEEVIKMPQMLYGPPPAMEMHKVESVELPQMLYGPPPALEVKHNDSHSRK